MSRLYVYQLFTLKNILSCLILECFKIFKKYGVLLQTIRKMFVSHEKLLLGHLHLKVRSLSFHNFKVKCEMQYKKGKLKWIFFVYIFFKSNYIWILLWYVTIQIQVEIGLYVMSPTLESTNKSFMRLWFMPHLSK